jgi:hypothetical protein
MYLSLRQASQNSTKRLYSKVSMKAGPLFVVVALELGPCGLNGSGGACMNILLERLQDGTSLELQEFVDCALAILKDSPQLVQPSVTGTNDVAERHGSA